MATIYDIRIRTVSPFMSYPEEYLIEILTDFLDQYEDDTTGLKFESTEITVKKS